MANELTVTVSLNFNKTGVVLQDSYSKTSTIAGDDAIKATQLIGTSTTALDFGAVSTIGYVIVRNIDPTNFVELSTDNANVNKFAKLLGGTSGLGDFAIFKASSATIYATANTAACRCIVEAVEI